jgi:fatty-acid desaturase
MNDVNILPRFSELSNTDPAGDIENVSEPEYRSKVLHWPNILWITWLHVGSIAAFWLISWQGIVLLLFMHWLTGGIGICLGYHRLFTHGSFQTFRPIKWMIAVLGGLAGEGPVTEWVANHRQHHALSDRDGDPHSPRDGGWWSHLLWIGYAKSNAEERIHVRRWAPDLNKDRVIVWIGRLFLPFHFAMAGLLFAVGCWLGGVPLGLSMLLWGSCMRLVCVMHSTWFVNSASHMWGYRNYETTDQSRNSWWVALLTYGEGWHNNHHAYPRMAKHGHKWWEYDITFATIRMMRFLGLAWDVVDYKHRNELKAHSGRVT